MIDKGKFHKEIIGPFTGQKFTIRRVRIKEFMSEMGNLPIHASTTVQTVLDELKEKAAKGDKETEEKVSRFYATRGIIEPKLFYGNESDCPEDAIHYLDLGGDFDYVVNEIVTFSHQLGGLKEFEEFFRGKGTGIAGSDSQEVRAETESPPPEGSIQH